MNEISTILLIVFPVIAYLIGRYFGTQSQKNYKNLEQAPNYWHNLYTDLQTERAYSRRHAPKFQLVANKEKHPAANDNYLYVEGELNGNREAGLLRLSQWNEAKKTLLKNPEDKPL